MPLVHRHSPAWLVIAAGLCVSTVQAATSGVESNTSDADLELHQRVDRRLLDGSERVTFRVTLLNHGPAAARDIVFGGRLPEPLKFISCASSRGAIMAHTFCMLDHLAPGDSVIVTIVTAPKPDSAARQDALENSVYVEYCATPDPEWGNNHAAVRIDRSQPPLETSSVGAALDLSRLAFSGEPGLGRMQFVFSVPTDESQVDVSVFDLLGRQIATLARGFFGAGDHVADWCYASSGAACPTGTYLVRLETAEGSVSQAIELFH